MSVNETNEHRQAEGTMPLSVAIRTGARLTKPLRGQMVSGDGERACALGGALIATGRRPEATDEIAQAIGVWPLLDEVVPREAEPCRCAACASLRVGGIRQVGQWVVYLNDDALHQWPRERIAAWVAKLERK